MRLKVLITILSVLLLGVGYFLFKENFQFPETVVNRPISEKRANGFCGSTPTHGSSMATAPKEIIICSEGVLHPGTWAYITRTRSREMGFGEGVATIDSDQHTMRYKFNSTLSPTDWKGLYTVTYKLCTDSCSTGQFQFTIDPTSSPANT